MKYKNSYVYSLMELVRNPNTWTKNHKHNINSGYYSPVEITQTLLQWDIGTDLQELLNSPEVNKLWKDYILQKQLSEDCVFSDEDIDTLTADNDTMNELFGEWWRLFLSILKESYPRYKTLINIYQEQEVNLMKQIENKNLVKFNDTPQTIEDFENNKYVSHLTSNESKSDILTPAQRLEEVHNLWHNLYKEWSNLFDQLFIEVM